MTTLADKLKLRLIEALSPADVEIINESHLHAGHQPQFDGEGETHFRIRISSPKFDGLSRVAQHRLVNEVVQPFMKDGLHAIAIETKSL